MKYHKNKIVAPISTSDGDYPHTICEFSDKITKSSEIKIATQIEYMEDIFNQIDKIFDDGLNIALLINNLEALQKIRFKYQAKLFARNRENNHEVHKI